MKNEFKFFFSSENKNIKSNQKISILLTISKKLLIYLILFPIKMTYFHKKIIRN